MPSFKNCFAAFAAVLGLANASATGATGASATDQDNTKQTLTVTWEKYNPNGHARDMILVNGQFPAPPLVFDEGDQVEVSKMLKL
jgi:ABC-type glycerol-3-phosphate transport system substrate-binding protein